VIREKIYPSFDGYVHSPYPRAEETAHHLGFTNATWEVNELLRERKWGGIENLPYPERNAIFAKTGINPTEDSITWRPPRGESMIELLTNAKAFLIWVHERFPKGRVLAISHGGPIQAIRVIQHRVVPDKYSAFISGDNYIRNCHIFHFFDRDGDGAIPRFKSERSLCIDQSGTWCEKLNKIE
jgi:broad specificity phosphatase PhoE